ncbi:MAG: MarR family winged helix-turn-helix transcriptional regulator [Gemmatimonadaceae bacterium]|nr:MarR family winged helix-turn-helix transcriptional regulator [Gemmatimonadaceae bacterium]
MPRSRDADATLARMLFAVSRGWDELAQAHINRQLGSRIARPALMRLLPALEQGPVRLSTLAMKADVSKQAVGQALRACRTRKLVTYHPDPNDGRATMVALTEAGHRAVRQGRASLDAVEAALAERVGVATLAQLRKALTRLAPALEALAGGWPSLTEDAVEEPASDGLGEQPPARKREQHRRQQDRQHVPRARRRTTDAN